MRRRPSLSTRSASRPGGSARGKGTDKHCRQGRGVVTKEEGYSFADLAADGAATFISQRCPLDARGQRFAKVLSQHLLRS